uniref:Uncharacterized protein n=1 Tax=Arundo donax TaxID=35708 RepID=A0A0A8Z8F0_ARUDO
METRGKWKAFPSTKWAAPLSPFFFR